MKRRARFRFVGLLLVLGLLAAACGSDRSDDDDTGGGDETTTTEAAAAEGFGDLESPCGEAEEGEEPAAGGDQGVTADKVVIGYGDDAGFPTSPGLSQETSDAVEALIAWCNDQGGINGREIEGKYYDAKILEVGNAVTQACGEVFMLVGQAWALDGAQEETRLGCDLPTVPTYSVSADFANAPLMYQSVPNPIDRTPATWAAQLEELYPDLVDKAAVMFGDYASTKDTKDKLVYAFEQMGWKFLPCPQAYPITGAADWKPFAQALKDCGAEIVYYAGQANPNFQNMLDASAQLDYRPVWFTDANNYIESFAKWNTSGNADKVHIRTAFTPFEQAEEGSVTQQYVDLVEGNGGKISQLGEQTTSSVLLWMTAADACGADLSRDCVLEELAKIDSWTGGGLHAESNPAENLPPDCGMLLKLDGTEFVQVAPEEEGEFDCGPENVIEIEGPVVDQAELGPDRVSTKYKK